MSAAGDGNRIGEVLKGGRPWWASQKVIESRVEGLGKRWIPGDGGVLGRVQRGESISPLCNLHILPAPTRLQSSLRCWCCRPPAPSPWRFPLLRPWRPLPLAQAGPQNPELPPPQDRPRRPPLRGPSTTCSLTPRVCPTRYWWMRGLRWSPGLMALRLRKSATAAPCVPGSLSTCRTFNDTASPTRR